MKVTGIDEETNDRTVITLVKNKNIKNTNSKSDRWFEAVKIFYRLAGYEVIEIELDNNKKLNKKTIYHVIFDDPLNLRGRR